MRCINCGWENPSNIRNCEKCNQSLIVMKDPSGMTEIPPLTDYSEQSLKKTILDEPGIAEISGSWDDGLQGPSNLSHQGNQKNSIAKTIAPWNVRSKVKLVSLSDKKSYEFEDADRIILNREVFGGENKTIARGSHAVLSKTGGHWVIENTNDQRSTFIEVQNPTELKSGTIILIGQLFLRVEY
jgi:hypothetical protein